MFGWDGILDTVRTAVSTQSWWVFGLVFFTGVLTSLTPCMISMIPVVIGYVGGYGPASSRRSFPLALALALGLATSLAALGLAAALLGRIFGHLGRGWYLVLGGVALLMGLNILGLVRLSFPGLKTLPFRSHSLLGAFLAGAFFGLVASPCTTPVLAVLITYVASQQQVLYGGLLLWCYGAGQGVPLLLLGTFAGAIKGMKALKPFSPWVSKASGVLLAGFGVYLLLRVW